MGFIVNAAYNKADFSAYQSVGKRLRQYSPPFIKNSQVKIPQMHGYKDMASFEKAAPTIEENIMAILTPPQKTHSSKQRPDAHNYSKYTLEYLDTIVAMLKCMPERLEGARILHIASGYGRLSYFLRDEYKAKPTGADIDEVAVKYARDEGGLDFRVCDAQKLPFASNSFDAVVTHNFLIAGYLGRFMPDPWLFMGKVVQEIQRVLQPEGLFFSNYEQVDCLPVAFTMFQAYLRLFTPKNAPVVIRDVDILQK
ncbi:class I SAM-dependent methyltransferase [Candidatus Margulisiibacteriota bacterium]